MDERLDFIEVSSKHQDADLGVEVMAGLTASPKRLPSKLFYDQRGSELFEQITELPEYYLTRCEASILDQHASEIVAAVGPHISLIEFGSGSSAKTRALIEAAFRQQQDLKYVPIDISRDFLFTTAKSLLDRYPTLRITALAAEYFDAIGHLPPSDDPRLILFLGSNIGNFTPAESHTFLSRIRAQMQPQDRLVIGIDLAKDPSIIEPAYNDAQGVTEAFNKNILLRLNADLDANFDLDCFEHQAPFLPEESKIEMRLVSRIRQRVCVNAIERPFIFQKGEYIHTENSYKFTLDRFSGMASEAGLNLAKHWTDDKGWFALTLLEPAS